MKMTLEQFIKEEQGILKRFNEWWITTQVLTKKHKATKNFPSKQDYTDWIDQYFDYCNSQELPKQKETSGRD